MSFTSLVTVAAESGAHPEGGVNPWVVGVGIFVLLALLMGALVVFGGGREHS